MDSDFKKQQIELLMTDLPQNAQELSPVRLKCYRDLSNVIDTSWQDGWAQGQRVLVLCQLTRQVGVLPAEVTALVERLSLSRIEDLADALLGFSSLEDLQRWLN